MSSTNTFQPGNCVKHKTGGPEKMVVIGDSPNTHVPGLLCRWFQDGEFTEDVFDPVELVICDCPNDI